MQFLKMNGAGNDFVIFDARQKDIHLSDNLIRKICARKNIGCDQLIIIKKDQEADALMEIYNPDASKAESCGNATRCVAALLFEDLQKTAIKIKSAAGILPCTKNGELISVNMGKVTFKPNVSLFGFDFKCAEIGNPHAICFLDKEISNAEFFKIAPQVEAHPHFPNRTNVEFARILSDSLIEVRVFERGAGETLACGSGACSVAAVAIENSLVKTNQVTIRFKGGDLIISKNPDASITMTGSYQKIFAAEINPEFANE